MQEKPSTAPLPEFDCLLCGHCCEGRGGIVVSDSDLDRLCTHFSMDADVFIETWAVRHDSKLFIRSSDDGCVFFEKGKGCSVHEAKPDICRAWPYFRGNLVDRESFTLAKEFCPGIPAQQLHADFVHEGLEYLNLQGLLGKGGSSEANALQLEDLVERLAKDKRTL